MQAVTASSRLHRFGVTLSSRRELGVLAAMLVAAAIFPRRVPAPVGMLGMLGGGALALQAIGLILIYQTDGIINFAQVQIGAVGATFFVLFARYAPLFTIARTACPVCLEHVSASANRWNYLAAALLGIGVSLFISWLISRLVIRRFASSPRLVPTVATVFLVPVLALAQRAMANTLATRDQKALTAGAVSLAAPTPPVHLTVRWGVVVFGLPQLLLIVLLALGLALVWVFLRHTAAGRSLRAVADNPPRAATLGLDVARIKSRAWVLAGGLSAAAMIVGAMTVGSPESGFVGVSAMVGILVVALIARMSSFSIAVAAALTLGLFSSALDWSFNSAGLLDGLLLLILGAVFALQRRGESRAQRERDSGWRFGREVRPIPAELKDHPSVRRWRRRGFVVIAIVVLGIPAIASPSQLSLGIAALIFAIVGLSILVLSGWAGQISLGQMGFAAIGAYVAAVAHLPFPLGLVAGALAGGAAAGLVGLPALRLRGMHLAVMTLAFALATSALLLDEHRFGKFLPASLGRPRILRLSDDHAFYYCALVIAGIVVATVLALRRSRFARVLIAARDNEQAAETFGVSLIRARLAAFFVSGFLAALAGALLAYQQTGVHAASFAPEESVRAFLWSVIGGLGAIAGPLLGAVGRGITDIFAGNPLVQLLAAGAGGLLLLIAAPGGLARIVFGIRDSTLRRLALRNRIVVPSLVADVRQGQDVVAIAAPSGRAPTPHYRVEDQWAIERTLHG